ncbi:hypothetical protein RM190_04905 [Paracoccus sp. CPCC 101403]|uniref:Scaffolding protein n=1 Tax=Paracoccus broussonetiae TaxID=3075834 RepID=A0ABU3EAE0_9RHOB|nr:hypothetical protein [Paracoccus sp. CPCC 101403]MDT1061188.1 hypothetical protein [Paracoccus sp. CPCC 101403]
MSDDVLNIFDEKEPVQPEVGEKPVVEAPAPEAAQPEAEAKGEEQDAPPASEAKEEQRHVPYEALRDERTKRQTLEREIAELRQWQQQQQAQQRQARLESITDPDERLHAVQQEAAQAIIQTRLDMSREAAERQHGAEFVSEVVEFFNDPQHAPMSHQFMRTKDPFGAAVEYYNAAKTLREIGPDPKAYETRLREQIKAELMAELTPTKPKAPPRSLSSGPAAGGDRQANPGSGFDELFPT